MTNSITAHHFLRHRDSNPRPLDLSPAIPASSVHSNSRPTNSAAILRMEIKHIAAYYFLRKIKVRVDLRGLYAKVHEMWHYVYSYHLCLTSFFQNYNILPRSGVRTESLRAGSEKMPNFVTFWPTL